MNSFLLLFAHGFVNYLNDSIKIFHVCRAYEPLR